jgi:hypothetical protein
LRARRINKAAKSDQMRQSRDSFASASVDRLTAERKPIAYSLLAGVGRQAGFDVAQALAPGQLRVGHDPELLGTRQCTYARFAAMALHDARKAGPWNEPDDLGE